MKPRVQAVGVVAWFAIAAMALAQQGCLSEIAQIIPRVPQEPPRLGGPCDFCEIIDDGCFPGTWQESGGSLRCVLRDGRVP